LGIDPGLANTGWALLDERSTIVGCGTIKTSPGPTGPRLLQIMGDIRRVIASHPVAEAALEELFAGRNATSAMAVAQARGAILASLAAVHVTVYEYKPAQVKAVLTGYGKASKEQIQRMVAVQAQSGDQMDEHAADAAAIALCHARSRRLRLLSQGTL
jgi:crossover junction endodeoxyribonuclease RuvC